MKLHKDPPSTRAIMPAHGSLIFALGVWTDSKLQPFAKRQQAYFKSSQILKLQLDNFVVPPNSYLFTSDAVSMYTNIPTERALTLICNHIRETAQCPCRSPLCHPPHHYVMQYIFLSQNILETHLWHFHEMPCIPSVGKHI
jgi:hypothetical protein